MSKPNATNGKARKILFGVLAIALAVVCFFCGFFVYSLTLDSELRSLIRLKNTIQAEYYEEITDEDVAGLIATRKLFPCFFGSALRMKGVDTLIEGLNTYMQAKQYPEAFGAKIYKINAA